MNELKEFFPEDVLDKAENVATVFQGDVLINNSLFNSDAVLVAVYMLSNKDGNNKVSMDEAQQLYIKSGKSKKSFSNSIYELTQRKKKGMLKRNDDDTLSITFSGLNHVKNLLEGKYK